MNRSRHIFTLTLTSILGLVFLLGSLNATAAPKKVKDLRWAYMMHIVHYVTWPGAKVNPVINVCVVGKSPFAEIEQDIVLNKKTGSITVAKHYEAIPEIAELARCNLIYFSQSITLAQLSFIFSKLESLPIVTIGDHRAFLRIGGLVRFIPKGKKLRFKLNKTLLNKMAIKIHPALLRLSE